MKNYLASLHLDLENTLVKLEDANEEKSYKDNHFLSKNKMRKERLLSISADSKKKDYVILFCISLLLIFISVYYH